MPILFTSQLQGKVERRLVPCNLALQQSLHTPQPDRTNQRNDFKVLLLNKPNLVFEGSAVCENPPIGG
jgi:hypothetical protein